ncbi:MAG: alpha/beta hydrolase [Salibaculum sp.]|uniref:alpha/beta hydrolase n=1 Tax=Salibaculum sp. TaxID=2855480 RepID=UPI00287009C1|nr:alpha/beta hydrolase [Salibaculum sp.]MDR9427147.1 alpha/beta hydrolase [Salibaculum sp.]MDR9482230.1 alpha/beta hydrolase [Salibaculum sp.]
MADDSGIDWEDAFANGDYIVGAEDYTPRWQAAAEAFRAQARGRCDIAYGAGSRARLDLFTPDAPARGLVVFVHGGYWRAFDKSTWSHLAAGPLALGWAVALPSYPLAPEARLAGIAEQAGRAVAHAAGLVAGPVRLAGHSAGGHLATRLTCTDAPLPAEVADRVERVVSISGLHDLRPLTLHSMNADLRLDAAEARAQSPALATPRPGIATTAWVGAGERPEFLRQAALLAEAWGAPLVAEPGRHHFDVIDGLAGADHPLTRRLAGD